MILNNFHLVLIVCIFASAIFKSEYVIQEIWQNKRNGLHPRFRLYAATAFTWR